MKPGRERRYARRLEILVSRDAWLMDALVCVRRLGLPDAWIGAGAVRRLVWDHLAERPTPTPVDDVDVLFYDRRDRSRAREAAAERRLRLWRRQVPWSVKNQARMHLRKGQPPYRDTADAMRFWLETPTCVAVALDRRSRLRVVAPYGLADLFEGRLRPTPAGRRCPGVYRARIEKKRWRERWPMLRQEPAFIDGQPASG